MEQETVSGSGISWAICKSAPRSRQITTPASHHSVFLQAGCPSCHPSNSVKALKASRLSVHYVFNLSFHTACLNALYLYSACLFCHLHVFFGLCHGYVGEILLVGVITQVFAFCLCYANKGVTYGGGGLALSIAVVQSLYLSVCLSHALSSKRFILLLRLLQNTNRKPHSGSQAY